MDAAAEEATKTETATTEEEPAQPAAPLFTQNLPPTNAQTEAEKRAARAARFGVVVAPAAAAAEGEEEKKKEGEEGDADKGTEEAPEDDAVKKAARASRFGLANERVAALDSALPDRAPRKRGRGLEGAAGGENKEEGGRDRKRRGERNGAGGGGGAGAGAGKGNAQAPKGPAKPAGRAAVDPAEKARMEARAKRFA